MVTIEILVVNLLQNNYSRFKPLGGVVLSQPEQRIIMYCKVLLLWLKSYVCYLKSLKTTCLMKLKCNSQMHLKAGCVWSCPVFGMYFKPAMEVLLFEITSCCLIVRYSMQQHIQLQQDWHQILCVNSFSDFTIKVTIRRKTIGPVGFCFKPFFFSQRQGSKWILTALTKKKPS